MSFGIDFCQLNLRRGDSITCGDKTASDTADGGCSDETIGEGQLYMWIVFAEIDRNKGQHLEGLGGRGADLDTAGIENV